MTILKWFRPPRDRSIFNTVVGSSLFLQHHKQVFALAMVLTVLRGDYTSTSGLPPNNTVIYCQHQVLRPVHNCRCWTFIQSASQCACLHQHHHRHMRSVLCYNLTMAMSLGDRHFNSIIIFNTIGPPSHTAPVIGQNIVFRCMTVLKPKRRLLHVWFQQVARG